jgi:hypothetical protein
MNPRECLPRAEQGSGVASFATSGLDFWLRFRLPGREFRIVEGVRNDRFPSAKNFMACAKESRNRFRLDAQPRKLLSRYAARSASVDERISTRDGSTISVTEHESK